MSIARDPFAGLPHLKKDKIEEEEDIEAKQEETGAVPISESDDEELTSCSSSDSNSTDDSESSSSDDDDVPNEGLNEQALDYQNSAYYAYAQAEYVCNSGSVPNNSVISPNSGQSIPSPANTNANGNMQTQYP